MNDPQTNHQPTMVHARHATSYAVYSMSFTDTESYANGGAAHV
jgi:hypothetical protein